MARLVRELSSESGRFYVASDDIRPVGILAATLDADQHFEIRNIVVDTERQRSGVGRILMNELIKSCDTPRISAETDDEAVGFYHSLGFRIRSLGEKYPGIVRYDCSYDYEDWNPPSFEEVTNRFIQSGIRHWVSGGWAIDIHLGRKTRTHLDLDVSVLRKDQYKLHDIFPGWEIYHQTIPRLLVDTHSDVIATNIFLPAQDSLLRVRMMIV